MNSPDEMLRALAQAHGVHTGFHDLNGRYHTAPPETLRALLTGLGVDPTDPNDAFLENTQKTENRTLPRELSAFADENLTVPVKHPCEWVLTDEDDAIIAQGRATDTIDLPIRPVGYFHLRITAKSQHSDCLVLSKPRRAPSLASKLNGAKGWGMTAALYGLRSQTNGGLGHFNDLRDTAQTLGAMGAQFLGINPIHALGRGRDDIISPYSPSHRGFFNTDHLALPDGLGPTPTDALINYDGFRKAHRTALEAAFETFLTSTQRGDFEAWAKNASPQMAQFAQFEAISEQHGPDFQKWPRDLQTIGPAAENAAADRAPFHMWLQWMAKTQINAAQDAATAAGMGLGLYLDLAVGPRLDGAEVWMNPATIARGVTIGAPPDHLSPAGQSWALAAHAPGKLAKNHYQPLRAMLSKLMATCGLLRIDHALGLARSFWLPEDGSPGGYITQPFASLLAVIMIEAHKNDCVIVGEDLGLVPDGFREAMNAAGLYSYAVWQFEGRGNDTIAPSSTLAPQALACFSTHDTPTLKGFWHGADIEWWTKVGWINDAERTARHGIRAKQRTSLRAVCGLTPDAQPDQAMHAIHTHLARAPSALVSVQLEDALGLTQAQNLPGTINEHPNWQRRLPVAVQDLGQSQALRQIADILQANRPAQPSEPETDHDPNHP
ncbi:4-alpha-glucanotransferase [Algirhabdus cladophorae]|uniref:4-alpha-glucanotransferase n=1 Tax=Algirhabdus cladophorae TaxID=3377108 RepID=UPI003B84994C